MRRDEPNSQLGDPYGGKAEPCPLSPGVTNQIATHGGRTVHLDILVCQPQKPDRGNDRRRPAEPTHAPVGPDRELVTGILNRKQCIYIV
jgi:hypothetical protein